MYRSCTYTVAALLTMLGVTSALAQSQSDWGGWAHPMWGGGHMMFGGVMMIIFWGGIILLVILLVRWFGANRLSNGSSEFARATPLDILKERYAKGEIDKKEYEQRKKVLSQ